jgi:hypothetical protein
MAGKKITTHYKSDFVDFIKGLDWDWCITIGIGACPEDDEALRRLRLIEASFAKDICSTDTTGFRSVTGSRRL